jgi:mannitol-specific phosphotransferase system IIBC component
MKALNDLVSNPGVAVLLGVVVSTFGTALSSFLTSRLEERRMDREDSRQQEQVQREAKERENQAIQDELQRKHTLYNEFAASTDVSMASSSEDTNTLNRLYFQTAIVASVPVGDAARGVREAARNVLNISDETAQDYFEGEGIATAKVDRLMSELDKAREIYLAAVREELQRERRE